VLELQEKGYFSISSLRRSWTIFSGNSDEYVTHGKKSLRLELYPSDYPGLEPLLAANDWRRYRAFSFDIFNRQAVRVPITVRIDDRQDYPDYEDRFNRNFILEPGPNLVRIPLAGLATSGGKRILNLKSIFRVFIFMAHPEKRIVLYVDSIRLVSE
jgi:hypothetical protein